MSIRVSAVWGQELALKMLREAGFADTQVHEVPHDPLDPLYVSRKRGD